ncbi:MAG: DUF6311 domain-containing protein, partial [Acidobacteria bacterium]|nr:DUF6311 domain-containing protein [Acidobacteriota bacterium]
FQYLGLWLLLCFTLQGALAARLIGRWSASAPVQVLGAALFVLLPTLLTRVGHEALCSHWLVLWALLVASREPTRRVRPLEWAALGLVSGMIQPYLAAMVLPLLAAAALTGRGASMRSRVSAMGAATAATVAGWWVSGLFLLQGQGSLAAEGLGYYSMNLLAPVSPGGWSCVLPALPIAGNGQEYEGFQYFGLGNLLLIAVAALLVASRRPIAGSKEARRIWAPATAGVCLLMAAFAVSPRITLGSRVLADLTGPWSAPLSAFRSSVRFFWPLAYLTLAWAVATVARRLPRRLVIGVVAAAVVVQAADLHAVYQDRRRTARDPAFYERSQPLTSQRWSSIASHYANLALVPPPQCGRSPLPYEPAVRLAATHGLTVNAGTVARSDEGARRQYCADFDADIAAARLTADTLYVVSAETADVLRRTSGPSVVCGAVDAVWLCTTSDAYIAWRNAAAFDELRLQR